LDVHDLFDRQNHVILCVGFLSTLEYILLFFLLPQ